MDEPKPEQASSTASLTGRELEVLQLVVEGFSNPGIAAELSVSPRTVQSHVASALAKTGARSRTHLAVIAVRTGLLRSELASKGGKP
jgi:DNA-binding NarL/FixJ family response regulator